jgi:predicted kinase
VVVNLHGMAKRMRNRYGTAPYCLVLWLSFSLLLSRLVQSRVLASMWLSLHFDVIWRLSSD